MKKIIAAFTCVALSLIFSGCAPQSAPAPELLTPVGSQMDTATAVVGDIEDMDIYEAAIAPEFVEMYFTHDAQIGSLLVDLGDEVSKGDKLVEIDVSAINAQLGALASEKASLEEEGEYLAALYEIDMELYELELKKLSDDAAYDMQTEIELYKLEYQNAADARAERLEAIEAQVQALNAQLEDIALTSPCDGRVTYLGCVAGQTVGAYDTVCVVTDDKKMVLQSDFISPATLANAVEIYALSEGARLEIEAVEVDEEEYSRAMLRGVEYESTFTLAGDYELRLGQTAVVCVVTTRVQDVLKLPANCVFEEDDEYYVYVVDGESRTRVGVGVGTMTDVEVEITSGLEEGSVVYVGN